MNVENKKEAARKKSLGELGELFAIKTLVDEQYDKIRNLNDERINEAFADIYCEKGDKRLIISVKTRKLIISENTVLSEYTVYIDDIKSDDWKLLYEVI